MRYTICGFDQKVLIKHGLDMIDAVLLRYFIDFKDSGFMLSKENEKSENKGIMECIIAKQRDGCTGVLKFHYKNQYQRLEEIC